LIFIFLTLVKADTIYPNKSIINKLMKLKLLLFIGASAIISLSSCKKDKEPFDETSINTVYWDKFLLPSSAKASEVILSGEVGNSRDVDSVDVEINNISTGEVTNVTLSKKDLTLTTRKDWPTSTIKWYQIKYKPAVKLTSGDEVNFTLTAHTPFGPSQDLRSMTTSSIEIE
jgi:hypothetical protein